MITFKVKDKDKNVKFEYTASTVDICYDGVFEVGDILTASSDWSKFLKVQFDETLKESIVYLPNKVFDFSIPSELEQLKCYDNISSDQYVSLKKCIIVNDYMWCYENVLLSISCRRLKNAEK